MKRPFWKHLMKKLGIAALIMIGVLVYVAIADMVFGVPVWAAAVALVVGNAILEAIDEHKKEE